MRYDYELVLGLPHTNQGGLADFLLMAHAGHFQWTSISKAIGVPLSALRTLAGGEVYATFYFIETRFPRGRPIGAFKLDDVLRFSVFLRAFKNVAVEGRIVFDERERLAESIGEACTTWPGGPVECEHPWIRFGNIFITPEKGNSVLRVAPPANADFSRLPLLPNDENPYHVTKSAEETGRLGLIDEIGWRCVDRSPGFGVRYPIDPDRDTNGAGLVYFANYIAFMDSAERAALTANAVSALPSSDPAGRSLLRRRVAYYGNVDVSDAIRTTVSLFAHEGDPGLLGARYTVVREQDKRVICRSEAIKALPQRT